MTYPPQGPYPGPSGYPQQGPYGVGQPVAPGYPAYGPPGYGPMPGQPMPYGHPGATPPNSGGPGKWLLIVGAVVLVLVLGGVGVYALTSSSDDDQSTSASSQSGKRKGAAGSTGSTDEATAPGSSAGGGSDEDEIRQFLASFGGGDMASISCAGDRKFFGQAGGGAFGSMPMPKVSGDPESMKTLDITVTGDRATVQAPGSSQVAIYLRKEGGEWKFCSTDNPVFKNLPGTR